MNTTNRKSRLFVTLRAILLLVLICIGVGYFALRTPLGQELALKILPTQVPEVLPLAVRAAMVAPAATATTQPTPAGFCGRTDTTTLLFAGTGIAGGMHSADAVRILKIDFAKPEVIVIAFPRDLWVQTPELKVLNVNESLLGPAFDVKRKSLVGSDKAKDEAAVNLLAQTLYDNFGVVADNYITVNIEPWGKMVDTIGGVEVTLPAEVALTNGIVLPAGTQVLNGTLAKAFVASLYQANDAYRIQRQDLFVKALHDKVMSADTLTKIPQLLKDFEGAIVTDLSPAELATIGCISDTTPSSNIKYFEVSGDLVSVRKDGALLPKTLEIKAALVEKFE